MKEIIMVVFGTRGDLNPFFGLGLSLKEKGFKVTLVSNEHYSEDAKFLGLKFFAAGSNIHYKNTLGNGRKFISMEEYTEVIGEEIRKPMFKIEYEYVLSRFRNNPDILVLISRFDNGAYLACEKHDIPFIRLCLSPLFLKVTNPVPEQFKKIVRQGYSISFLNHFRKIYELTPVRDFHYFKNRALLEIALFPEWFADLDTPPENVRFAGFPLFDVNREDKHDKLVEQHINKYGKPFLFMMDSCIGGEKEFFEKALHICKEFYYPGILVTHDKNSIPENIPENILCIDFINMKKNVPNVEIIFHSGGIGTTARAMEANTPQIIIPRYQDNDHVDNSLKATLFGSAGCVSPSEFSADFLPKIIHSLIYKKKLIEMRHEISVDISRTNALDIASDLILERYLEVTAECEPVLQ